MFLYLLIKFDFLNRVVEGDDLFAVVRQEPVPRVDLNRLKNLNVDFFLRIELNFIMDNVSHWLMESSLSSLTSTKLLFHT